MENTRRFIKSEKEYRIKHPSISMETISDALKANTGKTYLHIESETVTPLWNDSKDHIIVLAQPKDSQINRIFDMKITFKQVHDELVINSKIMFKEPLLPEVPRDKKPLAPPKFSVGFFLFGIVFLLIPSLLYYYWYKRKLKKYNKLSEYNVQVNKEVAIWKEAWSKWEYSLLEEAFCPETEGKLAMFEKELLFLILHTFNISDTLVSLVRSRESNKQQIEMQIEARKYNCLFK